MEYYGNNDYRYYLAHHGILGMKWGIRRYQSYDAGYQRKGGEQGVERISSSRSGDGDIRISRKTANRVKKVVAATALIGAGYWAGKHPEQMKKAADIVSKTLPKIANSSAKATKKLAKTVAKEAPKVTKTLPKIGKELYQGTKTAAKETSKIAKNTYKGAKIAAQVMGKAGKKAYKGAKLITKRFTKLVKKTAKAGKTLNKNVTPKEIFDNAKKTSGSGYYTMRARKGGSTIYAVLRK